MQSTENPTPTTEQANPENYPGADAPTTPYAPIIPNIIPSNALDSDPTLGQTTKPEPAEPLFTLAEAKSIIASHEREKAAKTEARQKEAEECLTAINALCKAYHFKIDALQQPSQVTLIDLTEG